MYTHLFTHSQLMECDMSVSNVSTTQWCFYDVVTPLTYFKVAQQESRIQFHTSLWQSSSLASTGYVNLFQNRLGKFFKQRVKVLGKVTLTRRNGTVVVCCNHKHPGTCSNISFFRRPASEMRS